MTTYNEIKKWYNNGKKTGLKYMTVVCDTWDWTDYPSYGDKPKEVGEMEKIMEVYNLKEPFETQNGNEKHFKIMQRIEVNVREGDKKYSMLIDCEPKNYNKKVLDAFGRLFELTVRDFLNEEKSRNEEKEFINNIKK